MKYSRQIIYVFVAVTAYGVLGSSALANRSSNVCGKSPTGRDVHDRMRYEACMSQSGQAQQFVPQAPNVPVPGGAITPKPGSESAAFKRCVRTKMRQLQISEASAKSNCVHLR